MTTYMEEVLEEAEERGGKNTKDSGCRTIDESLLTTVLICLFLSRMICPIRDLKGSCLSLRFKCAM